MTSLDLGVPWEWLEAEHVRRSLAAFVRAAWEVVEPGVGLDWSWHLDAICEHLQAVTRGDIRQLVICIPPGHMKSLLVSVFWPAWEWLSRPEERTLFASHDASLVLRDSVRCRQVIESEVYRGWVANIAAMNRDRAWGLASDQNAKGKYENDRRGYRQCVTVKGKVTGSRGDKIVVDDPVDVNDVIKGEPSRVTERMAEVLDWWDVTMSSRLNDQRDGKRVVIMQRVHVEDLAGVLAGRTGADAWTVLCLPTEYDPKHPHVYADDPRTEPGELLFPLRFPADVVARIKASLRGHYSAQHDQRPVPAEGGLFRREWFGPDRRYSGTPDDAAATCEEIAIFVDCAFKGKPTSDPVCLHVWGRRGPHRLLLDRVHDRMGIIATKQALRDLAARWPKAVLKLVEDKANGSAVIEEMGAELQGVIGFNPDPHGDKWARAQVASTIAEAGNILLPAASTWGGEVVEQWCGFPGLPHDEDIDCLSMMAIRWQGGGGASIEAQPEAPPIIFAPKRGAAW